MFVWLSSAEEIVASQVPDESEIKISRIFRADEGFCGVEFVAINLEEFSPDWPFAGKQIPHEP